jgi:hypothetical protein
MWDQQRYNSLKVRSGSKGRGRKERQTVHVEIRKKACGRQKDKFDEYLNKAFLSYLV